MGQMQENKKKGELMIIHTAQSRGHANHGWLDSYHTFSFANYYNPERIQFGALRVINDDSIDAGMGFGTHPHRDMEIITIPLEGALKHQDSMGTSSVIRKGEIQIMSAGTGITHSEFNASKDEQVKLLQIWVLPKKLSVKPRYEQKAFLHEDRKNKIQTVVSPDGRDGSVSINQDTFFSMTDLDQEQKVSYQCQHPGNGVYVFVIDGEIKLDGKTFKARDGVGIEAFNVIEIEALKNSEVLLMEVPV
jgi:redox-sensitive bicupin YhaK (pirin superfamily)